MSIRTRLLLASILGLAILLTNLNIPTVSSQGLLLEAPFVAGELPLDDFEAEPWQSAPPVEVPLSAQAVAKPILPETRVRSLTARALHNGTRLAVLVEWQDESQDDQVVGQQSFRDAVALQFPLVEGQPFFCMGQQGGNVNIWHWKADWESDLIAFQDLEALYPGMHVDQFPFAAANESGVVGPEEYTDTSFLPALAAGNLLADPARTSSVEDLVAGGFGSLTAQPGASQNVAGRGVWEEGRWRVVFSRDLSSPEADDVIFQAGNVYPIAFAAWDGANGERDGTKSTSQWISLTLDPSQQAPAPQTAPQAGINEGLLFVAIPVLATVGLFLLLTFGGTVLAVIVSRRRGR